MTLRVFFGVVIQEIAGLVMLLSGGCALIFLLLWPDPENTYLFAAIFGGAILVAFLGHLLANKKASKKDEENHVD